MGLFLIYKTRLEIQAECFISGCVLFKLLPKNKTTDNQHVSQCSGCSMCKNGTGVQPVRVRARAAISKAAA